jgi:hypothetical protein
MSAQQAGEDAAQLQFGESASTVFILFSVAIACGLMS